MVDNSLVFSFAVIVITGMLVVIGAQVFLILKEFRKSLEKTNKILDDTGTVSESISKPISMLSNTLTGIREGAQLVKMLKGRGSKKGK